MRCSCGSTNFTPLGVQEIASKDATGTPSRVVFLINCAECNTTLSCSKHFYAVVKYLHNYSNANSEYAANVKLAH